LLPDRIRARYDRPDHILYSWRRTRAWAEVLDNPGTIGIWVNSRDRFPLGCVRPGPDYESVRARIIEGLVALRAPDGAAVFRSVARREDVYHGRFLATAPDVVGIMHLAFGASWRPLTVELRERQVFAPFDVALYNHQLGQHTSDGMFLFVGPGIL